MSINCVSKNGRFCCQHFRTRKTPKGRRVREVLRHLGLWEPGVRVHSGTDHLPKTIIEPCLDDPSLDYDVEPVMAYVNG